jgi:hypothetical protein
MRRDGRSHNTAVKWFFYQVAKLWYGDWSDWWANWREFSIMFFVGLMIGVIVGFGGALILLTAAK